jgi:membrane-bound lytic murein transglycosylase
MIEKIPTKETPCKIFENVKQLSEDIKQFHEKNREKIGAKPDDSANIEVLRIFGKQLARIKEGDKEYWEMIAGEPERFVSGKIHKYDDFRVDLDFYDYRPWEESGGEEKPERIFHLIINKENVREFRLQPAIKKIKPKIEKK